MGAAGTRPRLSRDRVRQGLRASSGSERSSRFRRQKRPSIGTDASRGDASRDVASAERPRLEPIDTSFSFKNKAYAALKSVIVGMDVYGSSERHPARRAQPGAGFRHQPHAGARGHGAARARRFRPLGAAARRLCGAQDQARSDRTDHRLGRARKHGGAADHRERQRRRDRLAAADVRHFRQRRSARASRRIFRAQYRIPSDHHPAEPQQRAGRSSPKICSPICG